MQKKYTAGLQVIAQYTPERIVIYENNGKSIKNTIANPVFVY